MAIRPIIIAPDPKLRVTCEPVERVDESVRRLMDDMMESMHAANGIGLAAPQVGEKCRVLVLDIAGKDEEPRPMYFANPEIVWASEEKETHEEGCLSLPGFYGEVTRPARVRVRYLDHENEIREIEADGLLATCLQHEIDHLDGILFVDYLSALRRNMILRKLAKTKRMEATV